MDILVTENTTNWDIQNGDFSLTPTNDVYLSQKLRAVIRLFRGEYYLDITKGLPYKEVLFKKQPNLDEWADLMKIEILNTPGVVEIVEFSFTEITTTRQLNVYFVVKTDNDLQIEFNEVV